MGEIEIIIRGSFRNESKQGNETGTGAKFEANDHGHAHAVSQAIEYLAAEVLPAAIALDHELHDEGARPERGFYLDGVRITRAARGPGAT